MKRIVYVSAAGSVMVVLPVFNRMGGVSHEVEGFTDADAEKRAWDRLQAQIAAGEVVAISAPAWIDAADIPSDRSFRAAWTVSGDKVTHDLDRVRAIAHDRRRAARAAELAPLDDAISKRIPGTDEAAVEAARQALRDKYADLQIAIDRAAGVDDVKAVLATPDNVFFGE